MSSPAVVLVHGGFVDGSGWRGVYDRLRAQGHRVAVVQNPTVSLEGDVAATKQVLDDLDGPVGPGGPLLRRRRDHRDRHRRPRRRPGLHRGVRPRQGRVGQHPDRRPAARSAGARRSCRPGTATCSWTATSSTSPSPATCRPTRRRSWPTPRSPGASTRSAARSPNPAWRCKPSWYLVASDDRMIPPPAQRAMAERAGATVREVPGSHSVYVSQPQAVADLIHTAVESLT